MVGLITIAIVVYQGRTPAYTDRDESLLTDAELAAAKLAQWLRRHQVRLAPRAPVPAEAEFRTGMYREHELPFGQRLWRVLYRPRDGWLWQFSLRPGF